MKSGAFPGRAAFPVSPPGSPQAQRRTISTRRFCGSRTPSAVGTSGRLSPIGADADLAAADAACHQLGRHRIGAALRQALVVGRRAGAVGVAGHFDPRRLHPAGVGRRLGDDLPRAGRQVGAIPVEEDQVGARRGRSHGRGRDGTTGGGGGGGWNSA